MIEGMNVRCNIGPVEVLRSAHIELVYKRRAVVSQCVIHIPDPEGKVQSVLTAGQKMKIRFGYRGGVNFWHEWEGTIEKLEQTQGAGATVIVRGVGLEKKLASTLVRESFYDEPAIIVARRLLKKTGLEIGRIDIPSDVLPHQIFSNVTVARAIKQLEQTLTRSFGYDLSKHALWYGQNGLTWSNGDEAGGLYTIETAQNLLSHTPPTEAGGMGCVVSVLLPGLIHSQKVKIRDQRRQISIVQRAEEVIHVLGSAGNSTTIMYGKSSGWGG